MMGNSQSMQSPSGGPFLKLMERTVAFQRTYSGLLLRNLD